MPRTMPRMRLWMSRNIGFKISKNKKGFYPKVSPSFVSSLFLRKLGELWMIQACLWIPHTKLYDKKFNQKSGGPGTASQVWRSRSGRPGPAGQKIRGGARPGGHVRVGHIRRATSRNCNCNANEVSYMIKSIFNQRAKAYSLCIQYHCQVFAFS